MPGYSTNSGFNLQEATCATVVVVVAWVEAVVVASLVSVVPGCPAVVA